ncbi:uncharacterized protein PHALS_07637 [Plasmopara halstedii]|uniref:Uncharacterized protein n=1 Tax=Plasmopara halstedii TaxID=4781 RepID=A0A0P1B5U6_PLAHL|nr:uncharacterized protein PHALS_07637 [Plasmopara halstedii]CEG49900.1 hypothetical protein PHALS_07637 [Plasmopara halstedii]|eukprot:XP_024586269.1 hypothetical protein PHALS_07637 [Plasmopara halstedii]
MVKADKIGYFKIQAQAKASRYLRKGARESRRGTRRTEMTIGLSTQNVQALGRFPPGNAFDERRDPDVDMDT